MNEKLGIMTANDLVEILKPYGDTIVLFSLHHWTQIEIATIKAEVHPKMLKSITIDMVDADSMKEKE